MFKLITKNTGQYSAKISNTAMVAVLVWLVSINTAGSGALDSATLRTHMISTEADILELAIHPVLSEQETLTRYQPVANFLSAKTGKRVIIRTLPNFFSHWGNIRRPNSYELILDAAHFTDYRAQKLGYKVLAKVPDYVSYSLVVNKKSDHFDLNSIIGKTVATLGAPSMAATRLNAIFANPARQPIKVEVTTAEAGLHKLSQQKVFAAFLPTSSIIEYLKTHDDVAAIITTEPVPHAALSAAPTLDPALQTTIQRALIEAESSAEGRNMLRQVGLERFAPASSQLYAGYSRELRQYWGY